MIGLSEGRGWDETYILDILPYDRLLLYQHAILRRQGAWTVPADAPVEEQMEKLGF